MEEESKAMQEVAKTAGKVVDAAREAGGFIAKFVSGPLEQGVGIFEDRLKYMRWERQVRLMSRAAEFMAASGLSAPTKAVPLKLALPLLQGATLEEDDGLQDRWAALLVNAANAEFGFEIQRAYLSILEQLTPLEAQVLDLIYSLPFEDAQHAGIATVDLPSSVRVPDKKEEKAPALSEEIVLALSNLARLGCIKLGMTWGGGESFGRINPTMLGRRFVAACHVPKT